MIAQLFTFEYRGTTHDNREVAYPSSFKKAGAALNSARAFRVKMTKAGHTVETRLVELVRHGTGRTTKPVPGERGEWAA